MVRAIRTVAVGATLAALAVVVVPSAASADTAPNLACGNTQPGPCQQTAHFADDNEFGTPLPGGAGCPAFLSEDYVHIVGTGNGVEHINVNKAQDAWFTTTFTGNVTLTAYAPSSLTIDDQGNVTGIVGPPDASVPVFSGKLTEWFGGSFNNKNSVNHGTLTFDLTGGGESLHVHDVFHASWAPGTDPNGSPTKAFDKVTCS
jgi:hypothetical protein